MGKESESTQETNSKQRKGKGLRRLFIFALIIGAIIISTPFAIQYGIVKGLTAAGSKQVSVGDVDFNPFTGQLAIKNLKAIVEGEPEIAVSLFATEVDWLPLFEKHISIRSILLKGLSLDVEQTKDKELIVGGLHLPTFGGEGDVNVKEKPEEEGSPMEWGVGLGSVHFVDNVINFSSPEFSTDLKIDDLLLAQLFSWKPKKEADFKVSTHINGTPISSEIKLSVFADKPLVKGKLKIDQFALDHFSALAGDSLNELKGKLSTDISFSLLIEESGVSYQQTGLISLQESVLGLADIHLAHQKVVWDGDINFSLLDGAMDLSAKGGLDLNGHKNSLKSPELETKLNSASWKGDVEFKQKADKSLLKVNGDILAKGLNSRNHRTNLTLLQLDKLALKEISINQPENIKLSKIVLDGLTVAKKQVKRKPLMTSKQITLSELQLQNLSDINLEKVDVNTLVTDININKKGKLVLLDELISSLETKVGAKKKAKSAVEADKKAKPPALRIGGINVVGKSELYVANAAIKEMVLKKVEFKKISVGEINNKTAKKPTPFEIKGRINNHSKLAMKGKITPFTQKLNADVDLSLKALDLLDFSKMAEKEIGYEIESGQMNADVVAKVKEDILDSNVKIAVHNLVMIPEDKGKIASISKQMTMPLDTALSMLRDSNNDINMEVPVKGDINNPDFSLRDVMKTALGNSVMNSATTYMMYALQPYGLVYMAADAAYSAATAVVLEPVKFQPNDAKLTDESEDYLEHIGTLMQKRPGIRIRVCGVATEGDRLKLVELEEDKKVASTKGYEPELLSLAKTRANIVEEHLESTYEISTERLFRCAPKVTKEVEKQPRVELKI
jgi:hypothetical protein